MTASDHLGRMPRRTPPYIIIARSFAQDLRYRRPANRPLTHMEAIMWMLAETAWKPSARANRFGAIHHERGQLSTTHRELARAWSWSKGKVARFLSELERQLTIGVELARCGAKSGAKSGAATGYARTLITWVNYEKFNGALRSLGQKVGQNPGQRQPELPGLVYAIARQPNKTSNHVKVSETLGKNRPEHGKRWEGLIFLHHPSVDWYRAAEDFERVRGTRKFPRRYRDGSGSWFVEGGEKERQPWQASG